MQTAALGLGELQTQSALNQPFYGQIPLFDVAAAELDTVKARLASRSAFEQAGIERPHSLTRLQFTPMVGPGGDPMIQVSTREPIREPYLDLLVEVVWPDGRLVKGYTVLLDPPAVGAPSVARVPAPRSTQTGRSPFVAAAGGAGASPPPTPMGSPAAGAARASASESPVDERVIAGPEVGVEVVVNVEIPPGAAEIDFPLRYGPVPPGAGLAMIARRLTPPIATLEQTALALYRNSQDAFIDGDINRLRLGAELSIPTAAELFALDPRSAREQYRAALSGRPVAQFPLTDVETRLTISTPALDERVVSDGGGVDEAVVEVDAIEVATSRAAGPEPNADPGRAALEAELLLMREASEANRQEATELRDRVQSLEAQLDDIRRLLELRNEQLAQLAAVERSAVGASGAPDSVVSEAETATDAAVEPARAAAGMGAEVEDDPGAQPRPALASTSAPTSEPPSEPPSEPASELASPPSSTPETRSDAGPALLGMLGRWLKAAQGLALPALAVLLSMLLLGLLWYRRRQAAGTTRGGPAPAPPVLDTGGPDEADALSLDLDWAAGAAPSQGSEPPPETTSASPPRSAQLESLQPEAPASLSEPGLATIPRPPAHPQVPDAIEALNAAEMLEIFKPSEAEEGPEIRAVLDPVTPMTPVDATDATDATDAADATDATDAADAADAAEVAEPATGSEDLFLDLEELDELERRGADATETAPLQPQPRH